MISFRQYLAEQEQAEEQGKHLTHLRHLEDNLIYGNHVGVGTTSDFLDSVHDHLLGKKTTTHVSTKFDGAPSIAYGNDPSNGKFFVASKSAFNKNPKINYTDQDIEQNHGHAPGLVQKLKDALHHLPKIMPKTGGVFQGDMMYSKGDLQRKDNKVHFTPNLITYSAPKDSAEGKKALNSKIGIVTHTEYTGRGGLQSMSAGPLKASRRAEFQHHPDVNDIDPTDKVDTSNFTPDEQKKFAMHKEAFRKSYLGAKTDAFDSLAGHESDLEAHVNDQVRKGGRPTVQGYMNFLADRHKKEISKLKTQAAIDRKKQAFAKRLDHVNANSEHFKKILDMHHHMQKAKDVLTNVMAKNGRFETSIHGEPAAPEGAVAVNKNGDMTKFVNRAEFSRSNLLGVAFRKKGQESAAE